MGNPEININLRDCMPAMAEMKDNQYDLAIVDPPYFSGPEKMQYYGQKVSSKGVKRTSYKPLENSWSVPMKDYFDELTRVSKNQIIWGINYFQFSPGSGRIIWDKCNANSSYSDCEIASISSIESTRMFRFMWNGMMQGKSATEGHIQQGNKKICEKRIHPTQKPVILYKWLLDKFAKPGMKILDTHGGSMSIAIACHDLGFDLDLFEIDENYHAAGLKRFDDHVAQLNLFNNGAMAS